MSTYFESETHVARLADDGRVWVDSKADGSTVGRYNPRSGVDIHNTVTEQMNGAPECLHCTHGVPTDNDANFFISHCREAWGIELPALYCNGDRPKQWWL